MLNVLFFFCALATVPGPEVIATCHQISGEIKPGETLADLLASLNLQPGEIARAARVSKSVLNPRTIRAGQAWEAFLSKEGGELQFFIYKESLYHAVVFEFGDSIEVQRVEKPVVWTEGTATGKIEKSLAHSLKDSEHPKGLARSLRTLFGNDIRFNRLQKGDHFRVIYEGEQLDGAFKGRFTIKAASFHHKNKTYYRFAKNGEVFDEGGDGFEPVFLNAPIRGGVVTSHYTRSRFHPVLKRYSPHLGTDYGAKQGTPILAMADGVVTRVARNRYNGNYVKIRHDKVYETQYLHMVRWAKGLKKGQFIKKGTVIGYVGQTGLADGTHVCLRFWKNGRQVNFHRQKLPKTNKRSSPEELAELKALRMRLDRLEGTF